MGDTTIETRSGIVETLGAKCANGIQKWLPEPFLFAVILTVLAALLSITLTNQDPGEMVEHWYSGFWNLLGFSMQMVLILITGYVLAHAPIVRSGLSWVSDLPRSGAQAIVLVAVISLVLAWINWGFGVIIGALLAREVGKRAYANGVAVHYPLLCTAGYVGLGVSWHWGPSSSAPLISATPGHLFENLIGIVPTGETIFSSYAIWLLLLSLVYVPLVLYLMAPKTADRCRGIEHWLPEVTADSEADTNTQERQHSLQSFAEKLNNNRAVGAIVAIFGLGYVVNHFLSGGSLDINIVNFTLLMLGLGLFLRPQIYSASLNDAMRLSGGIVLQFPFYGGIMGMIGGSGLAVIMADWLIQVASAESLPVMVWLAAGVVNLFVPSGGGEWVVLGETIIRASQELGVPIGKSIIAFGTGDAWTNLFQPFWAIALLGVTGMKARDMFGYCVFLMIAMAPFLAALLTWLPY